MPTNTPFTTDPITGEPPTEEPPTDEPPTEEPPTDEPPTDEPPTDEPQTEEPPSGEFDALTNNISADLDTCTDESNFPTGGRRMREKNVQDCRRRHGRRQFLAVDYASLPPQNHRQRQRLHMRRKHYQIKLGSLSCALLRRHGRNLRDFRRSFFF